MEPWPGSGTHAPTSPSTRAARRRQRKTRIWIGILVGVLAGNALAAATYWSMRGFGSERAEGAGSVVVEEDGAVARAHRRVGVDALEKDEYEAAVEAFVKALEAPNPPADVPQLLAVAKGLLRDARRAERVEDASPPSPPKRAVQADPSPAPSPPTPKPSPRPKAPAALGAPPRPAPPVEVVPTPPTAPPPSEPEPSPAAPTSPSAPSPARSADGEEGGVDELPPCPEDDEPPAASPYGFIPRKCRPR